MSDSTGYLEIILGPMFSGKTTYLIDLYKEYIDYDKKILVVNYSGDKRYHTNMLSTHDKIMIPCIFVSKLSELFEQNLIEKSDIILINEGQFFEDIFDSVIKIVENHKKSVHVCGLDGDFRRQKFGNLLDLIPYCNDVIKLKANCMYCDSYAIFSHRLTDDKKQVIIGSDNYIPLCRNCYKEKNIC